MATDRGRAPHSVRQKSSIGFAFFLERTKLPIVVLCSPTRKETRCPTINQVSRVKIQTRSPASRVRTQIKSPANRHRIPAKAASLATRNKKQTARFGGPFLFFAKREGQTKKICDPRQSGGRDDHECCRSISFLRRNIPSLISRHLGIVVC